MKTSRTHHSVVTSAFSRKKTSHLQNNAWLTCAKYQVCVEFYIFLCTLAYISKGVNCHKSLLFLQHLTWNMLEKICWWWLFVCAWVRIFQRSKVNEIYEWISLSKLSVFSKVQYWYENPTSHHIWSPNQNPWKAIKHIPWLWIKFGPFTNQTQQTLYWLLKDPLRYNLLWNGFEVRVKNGYTNMTRPASSKMSQFNWFLLYTSVPKFTYFWRKLTRNWLL